MRARISLPVPFSPVIRTGTFACATTRNLRCNDCMRSVAPNTMFSGGTPTVRTPYALLATAVALKGILPTRLAHTALRFSSSQLCAACDLLHFSAHSQPTVVCGLIQLWKTLELKGERYQFHWLRRRFSEPPLQLSCRRSAPRLNIARCEMKTFAAFANLGFPQALSELWCLVGRKRSSATTVFVAHTIFDRE